MSAGNEGGDASKEGGGQASHRVPMQATVLVEFFPEETEDEPDDSVVPMDSTTSSDCFKKGTRVIIRGLVDSEQRYNGLAGIIDVEFAPGEGPHSGSCFRVVLDGNQGNIDALRNNMKLEGTPIVSLAPATVAVQEKPLAATLMCKKEENLKEITAALVKSIQDQLKLNGSPAVVTVDSVHFDGQPLQSIKPFRWVTSGSKLEVTGEFDTNPAALAK
eukprot:CAMPEP_0181301166 /NCGR_PEP_ID=MMETSP1101-20121128/7276_1 /TAXON_ID=46948 /ORGANISM="Rhodomonas abbreviata, Strain Caron Lab Isolate" /LENGTH=216 /DNA_ID=CAMNT_0023406447 /DNA_START=103 /DNA_END=750 /DNA_ORIENTATION=-